MKNLSMQLKRGLLLTVAGCLIGLTPTTFAATPTSTTATPDTQCTGDLTAVVKCLYNKAHAAIIASVTAPNPNAKTTIDKNVAQQETAQKTNTYGHALSLNTTINALNRQGNYDATTLQLSTMPTSGLGKETTKTGLFGSTSNKTLAAEKLKGDQSLTFSTLINPPTGTYTPEEAASAQRFITFLANMAKPLSSVKLAELTPEQLQTLRRRNRVAYQDYILDLRTIIAGQSVALSNLYHLFSQRSSIDGAKSALAQERELAYRRADDPKWYEEMQNASPATVQRETLYVLAEIRKQMFQNYLMQQRMLATLSAMELQNTANAKQLLVMKEKALNDVLNK